MRRNYRFLIAYDGSRYYGWEHQPNTPLTIQGQLEDMLRRYAGKDVEILGAGRTDAGVHALGMVAHAWLDLGEEGPENLKAVRDQMNDLLPEDIRIREIRAAGNGFHSRYSAIGKTYRYTCYVGENKPVFHRKYVHICERMPDLEKMRAVAELLLGNQDFASFCSNAKEMKSTVRRVDQIHIQREGDYLTLTFHGSGFLQHMVRILTGTLLEVGYGERTPESMTEVLAAKERAKAGFTAPAKGLCMMQVDYH